MDEPQRVFPTHDHLEREIAQFAGFAAASNDLHAILYQACVVAARGVDSRFAKVLRHLHREQQFLLVAGIGWAPADIGHVKVGAGLESPAGYAFVTAQPVVSAYLSREARFKTPALLTRYGVKSALNVQISVGRKPVGVLEVDSQREREFYGHHVSFIEGLASVVSLALERLPDPAWLA